MVKQRAKGYSRGSFCFVSKIVKNKNKVSFLANIFTSCVNIALINISEYNNKWM